MRSHWHKAGVSKIIITGDCIFSLAILGVQGRAAQRDENAEEQTNGEEVDAMEE